MDVLSVVSASMDSGRQCVMQVYGCADFLICWKTGCPASARLLPALKKMAGKLAVPGAPWVGCEPQLNPTACTVQQAYIGGYADILRSDDSKWFLLPSTFAQFLTHEPCLLISIN